MFGGLGEDQFRILVKRRVVVGCGMAERKRLKEATNPLQYLYFK
jgi:hypothetical protein